MDDKINSYPVGIIVNPYSYWLAATPDRNVYCPDRYPTYGLLEIKCPVVDNISDAKCLQFRDGQLSLKKNDNYYYQIQMQLAVTGLELCDFLCGLKMILTWKQYTLMKSFSSPHNLVISMSDIQPE